MDAGHAGVTDEKRSCFRVLGAVCSVNPTASGAARPVQSGFCEAHYISKKRYINGCDAAFPQEAPPHRRSNARRWSGGTLEQMRGQRMSVGTALEQLLRLIHRRAMKLAALPEDERDLHYDLIRLSCCAAAEHIGQSPDEAAITANDMVAFVRALVGIIEMGCGSGQGRSADQPPPARHFGSLENGTTRA